MTQGGPYWPKKKNLNIFLHSAAGWPNADLPSSAHLEVRNGLDPDERTLCGMFKNSPGRSFAYWRRSRHDLDKDIDAFPIDCGCRHAGKRYFGTRVPAAKHVRVNGSCAE